MMLIKHIKRKNINSDVVKQIIVKHLKNDNNSQNIIYIVNSHFFPELKKRT